MALLSVPTPVQPTQPKMTVSFALASEAREAEIAGRFSEAMALFSQAIRTWTPDQAPKGQDGQPETWWPIMWEGAIITLNYFPIHLFRDVTLPSLPLCSLTL